MTDPNRLHRFVEAQDRVYAEVLGELRRGRKTSHWMWFIFPQIAGLGRSDTARFYAIADIGEARAYLSHSILGPRLLECTTLVNEIEGRSIHDIFGSPDDLKFHSSVTLFHEAADDKAVFRVALDRYFRGNLDAATLTRL